MPGTLILKHEVASQVPGEYFNLHLAHRLESVDLEMSLVVPGLHKVRESVLASQSSKVQAILVSGVYGKSSLP